MKQLKIVIEKHADGYSGAGTPWSNRIRTQAAEWLSRFQRTYCMLQHGAGLFQRHVREPFNELADLSAVLEILEQRGHGHARTAEYPRAADPRGISRYGGALSPDDHAYILAPV